MDVWNESRRIWTKGGSMNRELEMILYKDFPKLYAGRKLDIRENLMPFGFQCEDGWFQLIYNLSYHVSKMDPDCVASEVKEKYALLSFYVNGTTEEVFDVIMKHEVMSGRICETCGELGKVYCDNGWYRTMCAKCHKERFG